MTIKCLVLSFLAISLALIPYKALAVDNPVQKEEEFVPEKYAKFSLTFSIINKSSVEVLSFASLTTPEDIWFNSEEFSEKTKEFLDPLAYERMKSRLKPDTSKYVHINFFSEIGWKATQDSFEMKLKIPANQLAAEVHMFKKQQQAPPDTVKPANYSGYINFNGGKDFNYNPAEKDVTTGRITPVVNIKSWALEADYRYNDITEGKWRREKTTLVKDNADTLVRFSAGDVNVTPVGFQDYTSLMGASYTKTYSLDPSVSTEITSSREFYLDRPALVEVLLNGAIIRSFDLEPGRHMLDDLPLVNGVNNIAIRITDRNNNVETIQFQASSSSTSLKKGLREYSITSGRILDLNSTERQYKEETLTAGFYRFGYSDLLTLGVNAESTPNYTLFGLESIYLTDIGTWTLIPALSQKYGQSGQAVRALYDWPCNCSASLEKVSVGLEYKDFSFYRQGDSSTPRNDNIGLFFSINNVLADNFILSNQFSTSTRNLESSLSSSFVSALNVRLDSRLTANFSFTGLQTEGQKMQYGASLLLTWDLSERHQYISAQTRSQDIHSSDSPVNSLTWNYNPGRVNDTYNVQTHVDTRGEYKSASATVGYVHQRFEGLITQDATYDPNASEPRATSQNRTHLNFSTALAFADWHGGITSPIHDSFVVFTGEGIARNKKIIVDRSTDSYSASSDWLNKNAIVPSLQPYQPRNMNVFVDQSDEVTLINETYPVRSTYQSGTLIKVGSKLGYLAKATVFDSKGQLIATQPGYLIPLTDAAKEHEPIVFFTDYEGRIFVENVFKGKYRIEFNDPKYSTAELEIYDSEDALLDLGHIVVPLK